MSDLASAAEGATPTGPARTRSHLLKLLTGILAGGAALLLWSGAAGASTTEQPRHRASGLLSGLVGSGGALAPVVELVDGVTQTDVVSTTVNGLTGTVDPVAAPVTAPLAPVTDPVVTTVGSIVTTTVGPCLRPAPHRRPPPCPGLPGTDPQPDGSRAAGQRSRRARPLLPRRLRRPARDHHGLPPIPPSIPVLRARQEPPSSLRSSWSNPSTTSCCPLAVRERMAPRPAPATTIRSRRSRTAPRPLRLPVADRPPPSRRPPPARPPAPDRPRAPARSRPHPAPSPRGALTAPCRPRRQPRRPPRHEHARAQRRPRLRARLTVPPGTSRVPRSSNTPDRHRGGPVESNHGGTMNTLLRTVRAPGADRRRLLAAQRLRTHLRPAAPATGRPLDRPRCRRPRRSLRHHRRRARQLLVQLWIGAPRPRAAATPRSYPGPGSPAGRRRRGRPRGPLRDHRGGPRRQLVIVRCGAPAAAPAGDGHRRRLPRWPMSTSPSPSTSAAPPWRSSADSSSSCTSAAPAGPGVGRLTAAP